MKSRISIPVAIQLCFDDVGWQNGVDGRADSGHPARSGIPRLHEPEDYLILHELGKAINQKILAPLVLGEWDKDNILRGKVGFTYDPEGWDRASEIDMEKSKKCFDILEGSDYIEYAIHGVLHSCYTPDGKLITCKEYFRFGEEVDGKETMYLESEEEFNTRIKLFFDIYNSWGFKKDIRTFVSPCGMKFADDATVCELERRLSKLGVQYHTNYTFHFDDPIRVYSGITLMKKGCSYKKPGGILEWNVYDFDPKTLAPFVSPENFGETNIIGFHWTNLLRYQPEDNLEKLPAWIDYFKRESETFGTMISRDIGFSATQQFYNKFARIDASEKGYTVELSEVTKIKPAYCPDEFYVSLKNGTTPVGVKGGRISVYEEHERFVTYKIEHTENTVEILL